MPIDPVDRTKLSGTGASEAHAKELLNKVDELAVASNAAASILLAWGVVSDLGVLIKGQGATVAKDVTGRYAITLPDPGIDVNNMMPTFTPLHISGFIRLKSPIVISVSDTQVDVFFFNSLDAGVDTHFYFKIEKLGI